MAAHLRQVRTYLELLFGVAGEGRLLTPTAASTVHGDFGSEELS
jgi:hypothetical protein